MMENRLNNIQKEIKSHALPLRAKVSAGFFKTGVGQYGEGDIFLGLPVPLCRTISKKYVHLPRADVLFLMKSRYHEGRLIALFLLIEEFQRSGDKTVVKDYLDNSVYVNNWDLVDTSADKLLGVYLRDTVTDEKKILHTLTKLARSTHLWTQRIAMIATFAFIRKGETKYTYALADILMGHTHDLMHKAVGWMLREAGKRVSEDELRQYISLNYKKMSRTTLRYAIEKFDVLERKTILQMKL